MGPIRPNLAQLEPTFGPELTNFWRSRPNVPDVGQIWNRFGQFWASRAGICPIFVKCSPDSTKVRFWPKFDQIGPSSEAVVILNRKS